MQWGQGDGPHCRLWERDSEGNSRYGAATPATLATEAESAIVLIYGVVPARRGFYSISVLFRG